MTGLLPISKHHRNTEGVARGSRDPSLYPGGMPLSSYRRLFVGATLPRHAYVHGRRGARPLDPATESPAFPVPHAHIDRDWWWALVRGPANDEASLRARYPRGIVRKGPR